MDAEDVDDDTGSSETSEEPASLFSDASIEDVNDYDNDQPSKHEEVNKRAGHIAVQYGEGALVWGGYSEVPAYLEGHEYYLPSEVWHYSYLKNTWKKLRTTGDVPNRCSGAGACLIDDSLFVAAGYHQVFDRPELPEDGDEISDQLEVEISNRIWRLNLHNLTWKRLIPGGVPPLNCDKTSMWAYDKKAYLFGGFGPPPRKDIHMDVEHLFQYTEDSSLSDGYFGDIYRRGWSNQLLFYDEEQNKWIWPQHSGSPPSPRACHSSSVIRDKVYIFGGRHDEVRLNDLYCLDMRSHTWSNILLPLDSPPIGRSWQSLTPLHTGKDAGALLLYGGFDNDSNALGDCWKLDLDKDDPEWIRMKHLEQGSRLWHSSVSLNATTHIVIGGITDNILSPSYVEKHHAEKVLFLEVNPRSLLACVLDYITKHKQEYSNQIQELPHNLRVILEARIQENKTTKDSNRNIEPGNISSIPLD